MGDRGPDRNVMQIRMTDASTQKSKIFCISTAGFSLARLLHCAGLVSAPRGNATRFHNMFANFAQT